MGPDIETTGRILYLSSCLPKGKLSYSKADTPVVTELSTEDLKPGIQESRALNPHMPWPDLLSPGVLVSICKKQTSQGNAKPRGVPSTHDAFHIGASVTSRCRMPWGPHRETQTPVQNACLAW